MEWSGDKKVPASPSTEKAIAICTKLNLNFSKTRYLMRQKEEEMAKQGYCLFEKEKLQKMANKFLQPLGYWIQITNAELDSVAGNLKPLSVVERFVLPPLSILFVSSVLVLALNVIGGGPCVFPSLCISGFTGLLTIFFVVLGGRLSESKERKLVVRSLDGACFIPPEVLPMLEKASDYFERKEIFCIFDNSTAPFHIGFLFARDEDLINGQATLTDFFIGGWCEKGKKVWVMPTKI
jgi:hypothetical protein